MPVLINGRTAVTAGSDGTVTTIDPCYTGPNRDIVNYQNIAKSKDATNTAKGVFINGHPVCHKESYFSKSTGDEAGDGGGIISGTIQGKAEFVTSSADVFIEGIPAVRQNDLMVSNNRNTEPAPLQQQSIPYKNDKTKVNNFPKKPYPKLEFDLAELPTQAFNQLIEATLKRVSYLYNATVTFFFTGIIILQKKGLQSPVILNLQGYEIEAKQQLGEMIGSFEITQFNNKVLSLTSSLSSTTCTASVMLLPPDKLKAEANPQPINFINENWIFTGNIGFACLIHYKPAQKNFAPIALLELVKVHAEQLVGTTLASLLLLSIMTLRCLILR